jgi:hypothetical protein
MLGSLAGPAISQTPSKPRVVPIPPSLAKDCTAKIVADSPKTKIVGPFATASFVNALSRWVAEKADVLIIAAPARTPGFMDRIVKHYKGCIYDLRDGVRVFRRLTYSTEFPPRQKTVPGEE